ncbi:class I adenylate-forming enzyme family protein [Thalassococcus sp. S3]|uniref:class I adenylate-forming enzyme family protein n=1 Tax=Thalassococcus sp. S3 TaxID=2017482 RepID=UPI0010246A61|nr:AMP-binding protein [Thalassococcus sp. S3]QBF29656.1 long-chain fatty acid--CoA ligase [Thalassococcus sp. S3]
MPLSQSLPDHARLHPDRMATRISGRALSYGLLWNKVQRLYHWIAALPRQPREQDILRDVPVFGVMLGNHPHTAEFLTAALSTPCCMILLDPAMPQEVVSGILDRLPPDVLFVGPDNAFGAEDLPFPVVVVDEEAGFEPPLSDNVTLTVPACADEAPFMVTFTSGTTSQPKAILRKRAEWRASLELGRRHFGLSETAHTCSPGPLAHGLTLYSFAETLDVGASFHSGRKFGAEQIFECFENHAIARLVCVPSVLDALVRHGSETGHVAAHLQKITTAGARLESHLLTKLRAIAPSATVTEYYGASELGFVSTADHIPHEEGYASSASGVGRAFPEVQIALRPVSTGEGDDHSGIIYVRSPLSIQDYLWQQDQSGFRRDGEWASVGDIGRLSENGSLTVIGRADGMVITGGYNVYPEEVAACLTQHPAIRAACILGLPDAYLGQKLVAVLEFEQQDGPVSAKELGVFCAKYLPRYKVPRDFIATQAWPMTQSGKIARGLLTDWIKARAPGLVLL